MKIKLLVSVIGLLLPITLLAQDFTYEYEGKSLNYAIISEKDKTCAVQSGSEVIGDVVIPEIAMDGDIEYSVTSICDLAFSGCVRLTSVIIPNSVTSIGAGSFCYCYS